MDIQIKRTYEASEPADGYRVLVDRLWPRGIKKENLHMDLWAKPLLPPLNAAKHLITIPLVLTLLLLNTRKSSTTIRIPRNLSTISPQQVLLA